jgi:hypothetical protein
MTDATIIKDLPALTWRGLLAPPYDVLPFKWKNRLPERKYYGVDGDAHDPTGRDSIPMSARLCFVNTVVDQYQGLGRLYPDYWEQWRNELMDGQAGDLEHPALGLLRARVDLVSGVLETKVQSGIVVEISWIETNEDPATFTALGNVAADPAQLASDADTNAAAFNVVVAPGRLPVMFSTQYGLTFPSGFVQPTLAGIFDAIRTSVFVADLSALSTLGALMGDVAAMVGALQALDTAEAWPAIVSCRSFWMALRTMQANLAAAARETKTTVISKSTTLDVFARLYNNSVAEIMALNAGALTGSYAPRGTALTYYVTN